MAFEIETSSLAVSFYCERGSFTAVEGHGKNKALYHLLFGFPRPVEERKFGAKEQSATQSSSKSGAIPGLLRGRVASEVTNGLDDLHSGADLLPILKRSLNRVVASKLKL